MSNNELRAKLVYALRKDDDIRSPGRVADLVMGVLAAHPAQIVKELQLRLGLAQIDRDSERRLRESCELALARAQGVDPSALSAILHCRYAVCTSICPSGFGWDTPRLNEVVERLQTQAEPKA